MRMLMEAGVFVRIQIITKDIDLTVLLILILKTTSMEFAVLMTIVKQITLISDGRTVKIQKQALILDFPPL